MASPIEISEEPRALLRLPFLGSRVNGEIFEYLLLNRDSSSALIALPPWILSKALLNEGEEVFLHLQDERLSYHLPKNGLRGNIRALRPHKDFGALYRLYFNPVQEARSTEQPHKETGKEGEKAHEQLLRLVKDCHLIKNGIYIYLKHMIPFFSRLLKVSDEQYHGLKEFVLKDVQRRVYDNMQRLKEVYDAILVPRGALDAIPLQIDLESLREVIQSEIDMDLFETAFDSLMGADNQEKGSLSQTYSIRSYHTYLEAIKVLEHRLYSNYNQVVILWAGSYT